MSQKITGDEPAHPTKKWGNQLETMHGLSIREEFARSAMQGLMSVDNKGPAENWEQLAKEAARIAVLVADALIDELNK